MKKSQASRVSFLGHKMTYLITHSKASIVRRGAPEVSDERNVEEVHQVQPAVQNKPSSFPVIRHKVSVAMTSKVEGVDEEEAEDDNDAAKDAPPKLLVHQGLRLLLSVDEVLHRGIQ